MKHAKKPLAVLMSIVLLLCAIPLMQASADSEYYESGPWVYKVENGEATITYFYTEEDLFGKVSVPETLGGYPVTGIERISCYGSEIDLYIPACVTKITNPETSEFGSGIVSINVDESNPAFSSVDGVLFDKNKTVLLAYPRSNTSTAYTIPDSVTTIGDYAFCDCNSLTSVTIPDSVTTIGGYAFAWCYDLESITIPDSVTKIEASAFHYCPKLTSVTIPDSVTEIGDSAFNSCESLTTIELPDSIISIGDYAFESCGELAHITLPDSLQSIGKYAFAWCDSIESIILPEKVKAIGDFAFYSCDELAKITVDESNAYFSNDEYGVIFNKDKTSLVFCPCDFETYTIPNGVTEICNSAFAGCEKLTNVIIPDSVTAIGESAFYYCLELKSIKFPCTLATIGDLAFYYCENLTSITIPDSVTTIGNYAFESCHSITSITIPDSVTSMGVFVFNYCSSLTNINLPNNITEINKGMFAHCDSLTNISLPEGIASIGAAAFESCDELEKITLPDSIKIIEPYAFRRTGIEEIYIPSSIEAIDYNAFNYSDLEDIYFEGSRAQWNNTVTAMFPDDYYYDYEDLFLDSVNIHFNYSLEPASGSCGANATWDYNGMGTLTISGTGAMASYPSGQGAPWNEFAANIQVIEIEEGITKIDGFYKCTNLKRIILPESLQSLVRHVFFWDYSDYKEIIYKGLPEQWANLDFNDHFDDSSSYDIFDWIIYIDNEDFKIDSLDIIVEGSTTVKYGETAYLYADIPTATAWYNENYFLPVGTQLNWYGENSGAFTDGYQYSGTEYPENHLYLRSLTSGTETVTVCLEHEDGYTIYNDDGEPIEASIELTSKAGIFEIIAYAFRSFFEMLLSFFMF